MVDQIQVDSDKTITKPKQRNSCRTIPVNHWNRVASKLLLHFVQAHNRETLELFCQQNLGIIELAWALIVIFFSGG